MSSRDGDYVDPSESRGQTRPSYERARPVLEKRQNMRRSPSGGHMLFDSEARPGRVNELDINGQESIKKIKLDKHGKPQHLTQRPAMDHIVQVAAIKESYNSRVTEERGKAAGGLTRTSSFDLHQSYSRAIADPDNLRLVTHTEHTSMGGTTHMGQFTASESRVASSLFESHMPTTPSTPTQETAFTANFPASAFPRVQLSQTTRQQPSRNAKRKRP